MTAIVETADKVAKRIGLCITERYCRANLTVTSNGGTDVVSIVGLLGGNRYLPGSQLNGIGHVGFGALPLNGFTRGRVTASHGQLHGRSGRGCTGP